jgi:hypothetical protein
MNFNPNIRLPKKGKTQRHLILQKTEPAETLLGEWNAPVITVDRISEGISQCHSSPTMHNEGYEGRLSANPELMDNESALSARLTN